jgi:hypothetical protein
MVAVWRQLKEKVCETPSQQKKPGHSGVPYGKKHKIGESKWEDWGSGKPGQKVRPYLQNNQSLSSRPPA